MKLRLTIELMLLTLAMFSIIAPCGGQLPENGLTDPVISAPGFPFPGNELNDSQHNELDDRPLDDKSILAQQTAPGFPIPDKDWSRAFGGDKDDVGFSVQETSDGGYIATGYAGSHIVGGSAIDDLWLVKTDSAGNKIWDKALGGIKSDGGHSVQETNDGGYIIAGYTYSYGLGLCDIWLVKTDAAGSELWNRTFGGTSYDVGHSVQETSDGGYIVAGYTESYGAGGRDFWLIRTNSAGNKLWEKTYGGKNSEWTYSAQETRDKGYIITGITGSYGSGEGDVWLVKTDSIGNEQWNKTFGGTHDDQSNSVQETSDGGYIIGGVTESYGAGSYDIWLIKTDSAGNELWNQTFGGAYDDYDGFAVQETSDGGYAIAASTFSYGAGGRDFWLIKTDSAGNKLWDRTFGGTGDDRDFFARETSDGGYIVAGYTNSYGAGNWDMWLVKTRALQKLYYPDFTDTTNPDSWRSWFVMQNPATATANVHIVIKSRLGEVLYSGGTTIPAGGVGAIRPRSLVGSDCTGSAVITSDQTLKGTCQITRNNNQMCMSYNAIG